MQEVKQFLALVCILRKDHFARQGTYCHSDIDFMDNVMIKMFTIDRFSGLIDYNFVCFRQAIQEVFKVCLQILQTNHNTNQSVGELIHPLSEVAIKQHLIRINFTSFFKKPFIIIFSFFATLKLYVCMSEWFLFLEGNK